MLVLPYPVEDPTTQARLEERYAWWLSHRNAPAVLDDEDRRRYNLGLTYVDYPRLDAITEYLVGEILTPANDKRAFMIEGPPLSGKTSLVCEVAMKVIHEVRAHEGEYAETAGVRSRIMTVNYFRGSVGEGASLMRNVLDSLDNPPSGPRAQQMLQACDQQVKLSRNRLSIGDDLNNLRKSRDEMPYVLKQLLDATRNQLLTSVNFEQSVIPPPHLAKPEYKEAMSQVWGRAHPKIGDRIHRLEAVTPTNGWMSELKHAVRRQSSLLRLERQHASDLTTDECIAVLARSHDGLIGSILSSIATAAATAVGTTECVGSRELGLATELDQLLGRQAS